MSDLPPSGNTRSHAAGAASFTMEDLARMITDVSTQVSTQMATLRTDMSTQMDTLRTDMTAMRTDLTSLSDEVAAIKTRSSRTSPTASPLPSPRPAPALPTLPTQDARQEVPTNSDSDEIELVIATPAADPLVATPDAVQEERVKPVVVEPVVDKPVADLSVATRDVIREEHVLLGKLWENDRVLFNGMAVSTNLTAPSKFELRDYFKVPIQQWTRHTVPYLKDAVWRGFGPPMSSVSHIGRMVA